MASHSRVEDFVSRFVAAWARADTQLDASRL